MLRLFLLLSACCFAAVSLAEPQSAEPHVIIINPGISDEYAAFGEWSGLIESAAIYKWGRSHNLYMQPDSPPVVDNIAGYIPPEGSLSIVVNGLKHSSYYTMWIDFVTFENHESASLPSLFKVFIKNDYYLYRELSVFSFQDMPREPVKIPIPFELSESGKIYILFEEYNTDKTFRSNTMWGIWDIIIANVDSLEFVTIPKPERKAMPYKIDILR